MENNLPMKKDGKSLKGIAVLILSIAMMLIATSISIYYLYLIPLQQSEKLEFEKQKYEEERKEKEEIKDEERKATEEAKEKEEIAQVQLSICIDLAMANYASGWDRYCKIWKEGVDKEWTDCRNNVYSWQTDADNKQLCIRTTSDYKVDNRGICLLPNEYSENVEEELENKKAECNQKYDL